MYKAIKNFAEVQGNTEELKVFEEAAKKQAELNAVRELSTDGFTSVDHYKKYLRGFDKEAIVDGIETLEGRSKNDRVLALKPKLSAKESFERLTLSYARLVYVQWYKEVLATYE